MSDLSANRFRGGREAANGPAPGAANAVGSQPFEVTLREGPVRVTVEFGGHWGAERDATVGAATQLPNGAFAKVTGVRLNDCAASEADVRSAADERVVLGLTRTGS